jgi:hypothetical protein
MYLFKYLDFILESKSELEGVMIFSPDFKNILSKIDDQVANAILNLELTKQNITYLDLGARENSVKYTTIDSIYKNYSPNDIDRFIKSKWPTDLREIDVRIGKLAKTLLGDKFADPVYGNFVDKWRSIVSKIENKFELWDGMRIMDAYNSDNYKDCSGSTLIKSCMNDSGFVELYCYIKNCQVLVLLNEDGLINGRALIWKDVLGNTIMDRIYFNYSKDYHLFIKLAIDNNVYYKKNNISGYSSFILNNKEYDLQTKIKTLNINEWQWDFPYMDTFCYAQGEYLMNYEPDDGKYYKLIDTDGGFNVYSGIYDIYGNEIEDEDNYFFSDTQGGYIDSDSAISINYNGGSGFEDYSFSDYVEKSKLKELGFILYNDDWYKKEHCVFSETEKRWIWRPEAIYDKNDWISYENWKIK